MSSMRRFAHTRAALLAAAIVIPVLAATPAGAMAQQFAPPSAQQQSAALAGAVVEWKRLQQSDNWPFADYASFMIQHPGWPGEKSRRAAAETVLDSGATMPALAVDFFTRFPPITAAGHVRFAEALAALGRMDQANAEARIAWRMGVMRPIDETRLIGGFPGAFRPDDHDARMDKLLWQGQTGAALRQLTYVSPARRAMFAARLAFRTNAPDAAIQMGAVDPAGRADPGFIADRAVWLRNSGQSVTARQMLAQPRQLTALPGDAEKWFEVLLDSARGAANDSQYQTAFDIARQVDDAYAAGTDISSRPLGERDDYTSLVWLAGTTAMQKLGRPADAVALFARYAGGSKTPQTQSKGYYWAGRAAEAAGDRTTAEQWYRRAAGFADLFYGQLAEERLRVPYKAPSASGAPVPQADRDAFYAREVVRATQYLGTIGDRDSQSMFVRQIAADAKSDTDHAMAAELSRVIGRPDLGVMVGRSALLNGLSDYTLAGYPSIRVPDGQAGYWTIIHAIARQESQFDRAAVSHAGARGLMQLMPGTAREQAGKLGLGYNRDALTSDTDYNIQLGSTYFQRMLNYYGGSYPLAVAAYNAGAGNVNKWMAANGDPRMPGVDIVDWIEKIPIYETKNYVQRVLENAVVYDLLNPRYSRSTGDTRMSWYLGKRNPG